MQTGIYTDLIMARFPSLAVDFYKLGLAPLPAGSILVPVAISAAAVIEIGGWRYQLRYWSPGAWETLPEEARSAASHPADGGEGFFGIIPLDSP